MRHAPFILAIDGKKDLAGVIATLEGVMAESWIWNKIAYVKLNDALFLPDSRWPELIAAIRKVLEQVGSKAGSFFDLKLADTDGTIRNVIARFQQAGVEPDIITVRESIGPKGFLELRAMLPRTKIALVSALTSIPAESICRSHGIRPAEKIIGDALNCQAEYELIRHEADNPMAFDAIVCSPLELDLLLRRFPYEYQFIVPGIRDEWMTKGQQARTIGVKRAIDMGATYLVMGAQLAKGNPEKGVSAQESCRLTSFELAKASYSYLSRNKPAAMAGCFEENENPIMAEALAKMLYDQIVSAMDRNIIDDPDIILCLGSYECLLSRVCYHLKRKATYLFFKSGPSDSPPEAIIGSNDIHKDAKVLILGYRRPDVTEAVAIELAIRKRGGQALGYACVIDASGANPEKPRPTISLISR